MDGLDHVHLDADGGAPGSVTGARGDGPADPPGGRIRGELVAAAVFEFCPRPSPG